MWKVKPTKRIGDRILYRVCKELPDGEVVSRGQWDYKAEAEKIADNLNKEEGYYERIL